MYACAVRLAILTPPLSSPSPRAAGGYFAHDLRSGDAPLVREEATPTRRTAPEIVKALLVANCGDLGVNKAVMIAPVRSFSGDWFAGCTYRLATEGADGSKGSLILHDCYHVKADTLEVVSIPPTNPGIDRTDPSTQSTERCEDRRGWPQRTP